MVKLNYIIYYNLSEVTVIAIILKIGVLAPQGNKSKSNNQTFRQTVK